MARQEHEQVVSCAYPLGAGSRSFEGLPSGPVESGLFGPARYFDPEHPELMDRPDVDRAALREELRVLEDANKRFGGHGLMLRYVATFLKSTEPRSLRILDLGTGAADVPRAIIGWLRQRDVPVELIAVDRNEGVLEVARENCRGWPEIRFEKHDLLALPFAPESFDLVLCSLALHHFSRPDAIAVLRRIQEIARLGYILNDLRRNWGSIWLTELLARTVMRTGIAHNDGPQSCRAAFTVRELRAMAVEAGLSNFHVRRHHVVFRMVLEGRK